MFGVKRESFKSMNMTAAVFGVIYFLCYFCLKDLQIGGGCGVGGLMSGGFRSKHWLVPEQGLGVACVTVLSPCPALGVHALFQACCMQGWGVQA